MPSADPDPDNPGGFVVTVAIADVAAYVRPGSALDREALERGNSVYFPDRVVPMLPERISNDLCSLRPGEDRPALAVRMVLGADGRKRSHSFHRVMMRSRRQARLRAGAGGDRRAAGRDDRRRFSRASLKPLWAAYAALQDRARAARARSTSTCPSARSSLEAGRRGRRRALAGAARRAPADRGVHDPRQRRGRRDAGGAAAPLIYRAHDEPSVEKLERPRRVPGHDRHQARQGRGAAPGAVQRHPRAGAGRGDRGARQRGGAALPGAGRIQPPRTTAISA